MNRRDQSVDLDEFGRFAEPALLILISLADGPKHGYAITEDIASFADVRFGPGTLSRPDLGVWSDGPVHESGRATVVLGVRGVITFELRASGANSPLHSGNWGGVAPNPAWRLVHLLASMRAADGSLLIDADQPPSVSGLRSNPMIATALGGTLGVAVVSARCSRRSRASNWWRWTRAAARRSAAAPVAGGCGWRRPAGRA